MASGYAVRCDARDTIEGGVTVSSSGSISQWLVGAKEGDPLAVQALWNRYFPQLVCFARKKLAESPRRIADEEDIALSAV